MSRITSQSPNGDKVHGGKKRVEKTKSITESSRFRYTDYPLVSRQVVTRELGISGSTLKNWRLGRKNVDGTRTPPKLIKNIHWISPSSRKVLYNFTLLRDYLQNINYPNQHDYAIKKNLRSLPSCQSENSQNFEGGQRG